jgi:hypothetical protein
VVGLSLRPIGGFDYLQDRRFALGYRDLKGCDTIYHIWAVEEASKAGYSIHPGYGRLDAVLTTSSAMGVIGAGSAAKSLAFADVLTMPPKSPGGRGQSHSRRNYAAVARADAAKAEFALRQIAKHYPSSALVMVQHRWSAIS